MYKLVSHPAKSAAIWFFSDVAAYYVRVKITPTWNVWGSNLTSRSKRIPPHGRAVWTGSALAAISPTAWSSHRTIFSASSFSIMDLPPNLNVNLYSMQHRCFSLAAVKASSSATSISWEPEKKLCRRVSCSSFDRCWRVRLRISSLAGRFEFDWCREVKDCVAVVDTVSADNENWWWSMTVRLEAFTDPLPEAKLGRRTTHACQCRKYTLTCRIIVGTGQRVSVDKGVGGVAFHVSEALCGWAACFYRWFISNLG